MSGREIHVEGVAKSFGKTEVLRDVSLCIPSGQTFALLGRNGAGKTTTIRILLGLLRADAGKCALPASIRCAIPFGCGARSAIWPRTRRCMAG